MNNKYSIKEAAEIFGVKANKLRFYEKKGLLEPRREENDYRYYTKDDLAKIQTILTYRQLNFSISDIQKIFEENFGDSIMEHMDKQWKLINDEISRLRVLRDSMEELMDSIYDGDEGSYEKKMVRASKEIYSKNKIKDNWEDRWNFKGWADRYDESVRVDFGHTKIYKNYNEVLKSTYEVALEGLSEDRESTTILDIGIGTGNLSEYFLNDGYEVVGIDQSRDMMNKAKIKFPQLKLRVGEFLKIPFEDNKFDRIVSTYAFHHLNDEEKIVAVEEMMRVLKPGGKIVMGDMMFLNHKCEKEIMDGMTEEEKYEVEDEYYTNIEQMEKRLNEKKMEIKKVQIDRLMHVIAIGE